MSDVDKKGKITKVPIIDEKIVEEAVKLPIAEGQVEVEIATAEEQAKQAELLIEKPLNIPIARELSNSCVERTP